jgi:hypothetical protein
MNSIEVTRYLYKKGYITKDAALKILKSRQNLVKEATEQMTNEVFGFKKEAFSFPWGGGPPPAGPAPAVPKKNIIDFKGSAKNILPLLGLAGLISLGTTGAKVGLGAISDSRLRGSVRDSYEKMFSEYPELEDEKEKATKFFNMMARFSPVLASNPIVAGTWVKGTMDRNVVDPATIKSLIEAQKEWENTQAMKSPLIGITRELPKSDEVFKKSLMFGLSDD